jgi:hypothetical protein
MLRAILLDSRYFQQCFQNCQGNEDHPNVECPESNVSVGVVCLQVLHRVSLGLVDRCNVIVLLGISANQIDSEDSGGRSHEIGME